MPSRRHFYSPSPERNIMADVDAKRPIHKRNMFSPIPEARKDLVYSGKAISPKPEELLADLKLIDHKPPKLPKIEEKGKI